jgi:hypothetical protein
MSIRGQSNSSVVGVVGARGDSCWELRPNSELMRSLKGTDPEEEDVVPSDFDDMNPPVVHPATSSAANDTVTAREIIVRRGLIVVSLVLNEIICPACRVRAFV